jgi:DNA polymerase-1
MEWPIIPLLARMEITGILVDIDQFTAMQRYLEDTISDLEQTIYGFAGREFNISSPQQLADILFIDLGLPSQGIKKGKTGYSTAASELSKLVAYHPIIPVISSYRELTKLKSTYVDTLPTQVGIDGRIHTTYNLTVAQTGRLSSADPNLQNIPVRSEAGKKIRNAFIAQDGFTFISADYSQFELRLAAVLANDVDMIDAFNSGADIHTRTAAEVYGVALDDVSADMRSNAKTINFGVLYGMSPHGLSVATGMSMTDAKIFIDKYFAARKPLVDYIESLKHQARENGYVETLFGRQRPTPDVKSSNFIVRSSAERQAVNMPIQGTEADLMKLAMISLQNKLDDNYGVGSIKQTNIPRQILQIHDSILVECPDDLVNEVSSLMKSTMESVYPELGINLRVDIKTGKNWGEL